MRHVRASSWRAAVAEGRKEGRMGGERQARVKRTKVRGGRKFIVAIDAINAGGVWPSAAPMVGCPLGRISLCMGPLSLPVPVMLRSSVFLFPSHVRGEVMARYGLCFLFGDNVMMIRTRI